MSRNHLWDQLWGWSEFQPIPAYSSLCQPVPAYFCLFQPIPTYSSLLQPIPVYFCLFQPSYNLFLPIPAYFSLFQPIPAYSSLFQPIPAYSSREIWDDLSIFKGQSKIITADNEQQPEYGAYPDFTII